MKNKEHGPGDQVEICQHKITRSMHGCNGEVEVGLAHTIKWIRDDTLQPKKLGPSKFSSAHLIYIARFICIQKATDCTNNRSVVYFGNLYLKLSIIFSL